MENNVADRVARDAAGGREIGFRLGARYNASEILFANLDAGRGDKVAVYSADGNATYSGLCAAADRAGNALLKLGLAPFSRVLMVLDDTPVYPAAFFGALKAGLVPVLINALSCPTGRTTGGADRPACGCRALATCRTAVFSHPITP